MIDLVDYTSYTDNSQVAPADYDQSKVPAEISKRTKNVRHKINGIAVRESLAQSAEIAGLTAQEANDMSKEAQALSTDTQNRFRDQIAGNTDINELIDARRPDGGRSFTTLNERLTVQIQFVNYEMFRDENLTDTEIIMATHEYANRHDIPVINPSGEYWLDRGYKVPIKTNTDWGSTIFHVPEEKAYRWWPHFVVQNKKPSFELPSELVSEIMPKLNSGKRVIPELRPYSNSFIVLVDETERVGFRKGFNSDWAKQDFYYVGQNGRLVGDKIFDFNNLPKATVFPCNTNRLNISGGHFAYSGETSLVETEDVVGPVIQNEASFVDFINQSVTVDGDDVNEKSTNGFIDFRYCYNVKLDGAYLTPRKTPTSKGTYGITGSKVIDITFENVIGTDDGTGWGIMGTNFIKDMKVDKSNLNRVDTHFNLHNLTIKESKLDAILITGSGDLIIEDVVVENSNNFIGFRSDYGATWDGKIRIKRAKLDGRAIDYQGVVNALNFEKGAGEFNFYTELHTGTTIEIDDFEILGFENNDKYAVNFGDWSRNSFHRVNFPDLVRLKDIKDVDGKGVRALRVVNIGFKCRKQRTESGNYAVGNVKILIDNVDLVPIDETSRYSSYHSNVGFGQTSDNLIDSYSISPEITIENCDNVKVKMNEAAGNINIKKSTIDGLNHASQRAIGDKVRGYVEDCRLRGRFASSSEQLHFFTQASTSQTLFVNSIIIPQIFNGDVITSIDRTILWNAGDTWVMGKHVNTEIASSITGNNSITQTTVNLFKFNLK